MAESVGRDGLKEGGGGSADVDVKILNLTALSILRL